VKKYPAEPLNPDEVKALMAACSPRCPTGLRNRALIVTLWRAGLRIAEALSLEPRDLDAGIVRVRKARAGRPGRWPWTRRRGPSCKPGWSARPG